MTYKITVKDVDTNANVTRKYWWEEDTTSDPELMGEQIRDMIESITNNNK